MSVDDLVAEVENLKSEIRSLRDVEAIRILKHRYCWTTDGGWDEKGPSHTGEAADLFIEDGSWDARPLGPLSVGREAIRETFRSFHPAIPFAIHNVLNGEIAVSGDTATGRWNALVFLALTTGESSLGLSTYEDGFVRTAEGWRFQSVKLTMVRQFPLPAML